MELGEKLQQLRKQKNYTQEELAELLFVSRTAISKWESGRGYPSIDSLKAISGVFSVSIDDLLSGEELISLAQTEQREKAAAMRDLVFGILDCMAALLFFLPLFGQPEGDTVKIVPLLSFTETRDYIWLTFAVAGGLTALFGVVQLALQNWRHRIWLRGKTTVSLALTVFLLLFSIAGRHPYPGAFLLCILIFKGILLIKRP